jgi:hypothetical protein
MTHRATQTLDALDVLVGEWSMGASFAANEADAPRERRSSGYGRNASSFSGGRSIVPTPQTASRSSASTPTRGNSSSTTSTLERSAAAPDFSQRFAGTIDEDGDTIVGRWEHSSDGSTWNDDFGLTYTRVR